MVNSPGISVFFTLLLASLLSAAPTFVRQPALSQVSGAWHVTFELSEYADVEVSIVNTADSTVVRHLAAGLLGPNAPTPFAKSALAQDLVWDGNTNLRSAATAPATLAARVRAGMSVALTHVVGDDPYRFSSFLNGLGLGPDGSLHVLGLQGCLSNVYDYAVVNLRKYDSAGVYQKTLFPFPSNANPDLVAPYGITRLPDGSCRPVNHGLASPQLGLPSGILGYMNSMLCDIDTNGDITVFNFPSNGYWIGYNSFSYIKVNARSEYVTPAAIPFIASHTLPEQSRAEAIGGPCCINFSKDRNTAYLSGFYRACTSGGAWIASDTGFWRDGCVYAVNMQTHEARIAFSMDSVPRDTAGRKRTIGPLFQHYTVNAQRMAAIHDLAIDASGRFYICDRLHQRIGVYDSLWTYLGGIPVKDPDLVEVHPITGEIYVATRNIYKLDSGSISLFKFAAFGGSTTPVIALNPFVRTGSFNSAGPLKKSHMILNSKGAKPLLWFAQFSGRVEKDNSVWGFRDDGTSFTVIRDFAQVQEPGTDGFEAVAVDRKTNAAYMVNPSTAVLTRIEDWSNPRVLPCSTSVKKVLLGADVTIGPDGYFYARTTVNGYGIYDGKITRWAQAHYLAPVNYAHGTNEFAWAKGSYDVGMGDKGFDVSVTGRIMRNQQVPRGTRTFALVDFAPDGAVVDSYRVYPLLRSSGGIQFDLEENVYVGARHVPRDFTFPVAYAADSAAKYGSGAVIKYDSRTGGSVSLNGDTVQGALKIYKTALAGSFSGKVYSVWGKGCMCRSPRFDVDPYGRLFIPNAILGRVTVVDNEDNALLSFGDYGNMDARGPGSLDPTPAAPLVFPMAVTSSEDYVYVTDNANARLIRLKMNFALDNLPGLTDWRTSDEGRDPLSKQVGFTLSPNPLNPACRVAVTLPSAARVRLAVYDASGRLVRLMADGRQGAGRHLYSWDGVREDGRRTAAGVYMVRLTAHGRQWIQKAVVVR